MRLLAGTDIQAQVRQLASGSGEVMAAVAYWGKGAAKQTGLAQHKNPKTVRVICDLLSGSCNPELGSENAAPWDCLQRAPSAST